MGCSYFYKWLFGAEMFSGLSRLTRPRPLLLPSSDSDDTHKNKTTSPIWFSRKCYNLQSWHHVRGGRGTPRIKKVGCLSPWEYHQGRGWRGGGLIGWLAFPLFLSLGSFKLEIMTENRTVTEAILPSIFSISFCQVKNPGSATDHNFVYRFFPRRYKDNKIDGHFRFKTL